MKIKTVVCKFFNLSNTIIFFTSLLISMQSAAQTADSLATSNASEENDTLYNFFMFDVGYSSNSQLDQNQSQTKIPSLTANMAWFHHTGIYTGLYYYNYYEAENHSYDLDLLLGYSKTFKDFLDISTYYDWHHYSGDTTYQGMNYQHTISASIGINPGPFNIYADNYYMLGSTNNYFLNVGVGLPLYFDNALFKNCFFMTQPSISASFGTDYWIYDGMTELDKQAQQAFLESEGYSIDDFGYTGIDIFIPITYGYKNFSVSLSWIYSIPSGEYKALGWSSQSGIMVSLTYMFGYKKK